ncbi:MAG: serine hydrolase family protein [Sphingomonadaceae bacterium]|nr:serine hydrolase family protein [Sphingomonadaceae bacterium]
MVQVVLVPGFRGSPHGHWQAIWAATRADCLMLRQASWDDPHPEAWTAALDRIVTASPLPVVLVAHSLGCATVAHWAAGGGEGVAAALLVAPCDVERDGANPAIRRFAPMPAAALPFRSTVVASRDDPYASFARQRCFAHRWGSALVDVGAQGHINADSGLGGWRFGQVLLDDLCAAVADARYARAARLRDAAPAGPCLSL